MTDYVALLRRIAVPRLAGSVQQALLLPLLEGQLAERGLVVERRPCVVSPASIELTGWLGMMVALMAAAGAVFPRTYPSPAQAANVVLFLSALALLFVATPPLRAGIVRDVRTVGGINLVARRPGDQPRIWLTAHYDSKGQLLSMAARLAAVVLATAGWIGLVALAVLDRAGAAAAPSVWLAAALPAGVGGVGLLACRWLRDSPGAVDNASGIITILAILDALHSPAGVGVILPDGEEYGLAGAQVLVREAPELFRDAAVINFDGIDDTGPTIALTHRPGPVADAVAGALAARRARRLPVLVDGMVFGRVARECVTIMRGGLATMRVVHTRRDTPDRLMLKGVGTVAAGVAGALRNAEFGMRNAE